MIDPKVMRATQAALTVLWILMLPISIITGWIASVPFVSFLSLWALVASHGAWWAAASVEVRIAGEDVPTEVAEAVIEQTKDEDTNVSTRP